MPNTTATENSRKDQKPNKPTPDFPLFAHATKRWAKKIRGKTRYFGPWRDPEGALKRYLAEKDYLYLGEEPPDADCQTYLVRDMVNRFLTSKKHLCDAGEITKRSFSDYRKTGTRMAEILGRLKRLDCLKVADFEHLRAELSKTLGPVSLKNELTRIRVVLKYAYDAELVDKPMRYKGALAPPKQKILRKNKRENRSKMLFSRVECRLILERTDGQLRAMFLLALNTGCNGSEVGQLRFSDVDLESGWLDYARPKTEIDRRAKLWPETTEAIGRWLETRPTPKPGCEDLVFLTEHGRSWYKDSTASPISREFRRLLESIGCYVQGRSFKALRHTYRTVADETLDGPALNLTMGHSDSSMAANYRQVIVDSRLEAIADYVREWLNKSGRRSNSLEHSRR